MGDPAVDIKGELLQLKDELQTEEKKGNVLKGIITDNTENTQGGWSFRQAQNNLGEAELSVVSQRMKQVERKLGETMETLALNGKQAILNVFEFQKRNRSEATKAYCYDGFNWPFLY